MYMLLYGEASFQLWGCKLLINVNGTNFCIYELYTYYINTVMTLVENISKLHWSVI